MNKLIKQIDKAGDSLHEGFVTTGLGRQGAVIFFLLWESLIPPSASNLFWIGFLALVSVTLGANDLPATGPWLLGYIVVTAVGVWSILAHFREMSHRPPGRRIKK